MEIPEGIPEVMKLERTICGKCINRSMVSELVRKKNGTTSSYK